jgi:hypothetical protein
MKLIEALKKKKELLAKADDLREKIAKYHVHYNVENPTYKDQTKQVSEWLQAHSDVLKEILRLAIAIQRTNQETRTTFEFGGVKVDRSISEAIIRRDTLAELELKAWTVMNDKGLKEGVRKTTTGDGEDVKIVRCYDPVERDKQMAIFSAEKSAIDAQLEVTNAITTLLE